MQKFTHTVNSCQNGGGQCVSQPDCEKTLNFECDKGSNKVCCLKAGFT